MAAKPIRLALMVAGVVVLALAMAAAGSADPQWAEFPMLLLVHPAFVAGVPLTVFVTTIGDRWLGLFAAAACATPMFMLVGAPPAGVVGALLFFATALAIGGIGFLAAIIASELSKRLDADGRPPTRLRANPLPPSARREPFEGLSTTPRRRHRPRPFDRGDC